MRLRLIAVDADTGIVVGNCGFKGDPGCLAPEHMVEIAYMTFPEYEGRGYGTAVALALVSVAAAAGTVVNVLAHTLPERNASGSILTRAGFTWQGEILDAEDGPLWRWRRAFSS
jgi:RimJ/RimL family protein N-acetyltransferase